MEQLNDLISTEEFIQETLNLLRESDSYWQDITSEEFRRMAKAMWRNPGEWHLVVEAMDSQRAVQAVDAWENVILTRIGQALDHARQVVSLDIEMKLLSGEKSNLEKRQEKLTYLLEQLNAQVEDFRFSTGDTVVSSRKFSTILGTVSAAADWQPGWDRLLDEAPPIGSAAKDLLSWTESACALIAVELDSIPLQVMNLDEEYTSLSVQYQQEAANSLGLAPTLVIEGDLEEAAVVNPVRPTGTMTLIGGALGLLAWAFWVILSIQNRKFGR
jgi:hypothetical protein